MLEDKIQGPWKSFETRVYFAELAGGFDLRGCPHPEEKARLAGAAPELLAELKTVVFHLRRDDFKNNESLRQQALDSIEAIILKATGGAS